MRNNIIFLALLCAIVVMFSGAVSAADVPSANFTANVTSGTAPLSVQFNDTSNDTPTSWSWNFGDNASSNAQNPVHNYTKAGTYNVSLTASNDAGNDTLTQTNYISVLLSDVYVSTIGNDTVGDGTATNPYATIQKGLTYVADGGTIHIQAGKYTATGNVGLTITKNVTIVGEDQSNTTIDAQNSNNIFTVNSGITVTIENITLANGSATNGGAIYNTGNLTFINCTFTGNKASYGGAIYNTGTIASLKDCNFTENRASLNYGGAIFNQGTIASLNDCNFTKNTGRCAGAIYNTGTIASLKDCSFTSNTASGSQYDGYGGAIYNIGGTINALSGCSFTGNTASGYKYAGYGGAIVNNRGKITSLSNCTFTNNTAAASFNNGGQGGAIWNYYTPNISVSNCTFTGNKASFYGGAIYNYGSTNTIIPVNYSSFVNNTATSGSTIYSNMGYGTSGTVNAGYNWWGSNNNPSGQVYGTVDYSNWIYMTITANPSTIVNGGTSNVTVSFNNAYAGNTVTSIDPANGHIPDGTVVSFSSTLGTFDPTTAVTTNGTATTTFTAANTDGYSINATTDGQTVSAILNDNLNFTANATVANNTPFTVQFNGT